MDSELTSVGGEIFLAIGGKKRTTYRVVKVPTTRNYGQGLGFTILKVSGGTDVEADGYDVFVSAEGTNGKFDSCNCKAWIVHGHCKHHTTVKEIIANGKAKENGLV